MQEAYNRGDYSRPNYLNGPKLRALAITTLVKAKAKPALLFLTAAVLALPKLEPPLTLALGYLPALA